MSTSPHTLVSFINCIDFGFARHLSREQDKIDLAETMCGSPLYMAPEILEYQPYDAKADLWSVGAVLFEMVAGKTPFHGENHIDLMKNIKKKAVRLPANVRISKEFVQLLKLLLNRKPQDRAGFEAFFAASEAFVALGCNGTPTVAPSLDAPKSDNIAITDESTTPSHPLSSGQQIVDRDVCTQMNLCAISENEGGGESFHQGGTGSLATVATLGTVNRQQLQQQQQQSSPHQPTSGTNYVVTPPLNPIMSTQPPPILGLHKGINQQGNTTRQSVFTPLQGSPNLSPYTPSKLAGPPQFSLTQAYNDIPQSLPSPRPRSTQDRHVFSATVQQQMQHQQKSINSAQQVSQNNNNVASNRSPRTSSHDSQSSDDFVLVEYNSGSRGRGSGYNSPSSSRPGSGYNSPSTSGIHHSPSISPHSSVTGRVTILDARNNMGICGTSPGTGRALFGKMMRGSPGSSSLTPPTTGSVVGGRFGVSPRSALKNGGCLAHIDVLVHMLAAAEDISRRAIQVAHLGDLRAFSAGELMLKHKEESQLSSMSTETPSTPMEGVDCVTQAESGSRRLSTSRAVIEEEGGQELPFAMTASSEGGSSERMPESFSENNNMPNIVKSSNEKTREEVTVLTIITHSREAIRCYCKALDMIRVTIRASRKVMKEIEDIPPPQVGNPSTNSQNPYNPIKKRCADSLQWSSAMFTAVLERADVANEEMSKLEKANSIEGEGDVSSICLEELIYNHSLKCGHEGAKKQMDGDYEAARECFKSAGLLAETLLMNSTVAEEDKVLLDGYVNSFADQILTLDELRRVELRKSRRQSSDML